MDRRPARRAMSGREPSFRATALAVLAYGVAMGFLEAAVVVYLRAAVGLGAPGVAASQDSAGLGAFLGVEVARELATIVMIAAVGWLAGRTGLERLAWAAVAFGAWDIVYYLGLRALLGWPPALDTWDVLFLVPAAWVGPVWAPVVVSVALVGVGLAAARRLRAGRGPRVGRTQALAGLAGGGLVVLSFLVDGPRVLTGGGGAWTGAPLFWAGMALALAGALSALRGGPAAPEAGGDPARPPPV